LSHTSTTTTTTTNTTTTATTNLAFEQPVEADHNNTININYNYYYRVSTNLTEKISRRFPGHSRMDFRKNPGHLRIETGSSFNQFVLQRTFVNHRRAQVLKRSDTFYRTKT